MKGQILANLWKNLWMLDTMDSDTKLNFRLRMIVYLLPTTTISVTTAWNLCTSSWARLQGPVVRRPISVNPGLNCSPIFYFFCSKAFFRIIFSILFRASNYQIVDIKNQTEFAFKAFIPELKFALTLGYFNPALNNPAQTYHANMRT